MDNLMSSALSRKAKDIFQILMVEDTLGVGLVTGIRDG